MCSGSVVEKYGAVVAVDIYFDIEIVVGTVPEHIGTMFQFWCCAVLT